MMGSLRRAVPNFIRRSYVLKFGITLLILGLMIGTIGFLATDLIQTEVRKGVNEDLSNVANQEANSFESWTERNELTARTLANSVKGRSEKETEEYIMNQLGNSRVTPNATSIHVINTTSSEVVASTGDFEGDLDDRPNNRVWIRYAKRVRSLKETQIVGSGRSMLAQPLAVYASPIRGTDKALIYLVKLDGYKAGLNRQNGTIVYVVNTSVGGGRRILFDSTEKAFFKQYPKRYYDVVTAAQNLSKGVHDRGPRVRPAREPTGSLRASISDNFTQRYDNTKLIPSYANVEGTPFSVVVHTPQAEAMGFVQTVQQYGFMFTLGAVLVVGMIGAAVGRNTATAIDRLRRKSEEMKQGNLDVDFETHRIDNIGRLYDGMASMRDALRNQIREARDAREEAEIAREEAEQTNRHLQAKANEYRDVMQAVAAGDLSRRMQPSDRNESMREIAEEFNSMIEEIEHTVAQLKDFATEVATSSEEVTASAEEVRSASKKVTESIQEISDGAERQDDALQSVSREMSGLSTTVEEIASLSNEVADLSEQTAQTGRRGREAAQEAIAGMNKIEQESQKAVDQIEQLDDEMGQIDELIDFISDVADQTNMLALNANIEASRAGEGDSGDGFGVVADEVKSLAAETKEAAEDIEYRLERIQDQANEAVEGVTNTSDRIAENTESVRNAVEALDEIAGYAQETNTGVQEISAATQQQAASTQEVVAMVDEAATISEETSEEAENVAAAAEEQTTAMTEVSDSASELSQKSTRLSEALDRFTTRDVEGDLFDISDTDTDQQTGQFGTDVDAPDDVLSEFENAAKDEDLPGPDIESSDGSETAFEDLADELDAPTNGDGNPSAGIGDMAEDTADEDGLGGTDPATFGDPDDVPEPEDDDMYSLPEDDDDQ